jgi:hypothetical protein
MIAPGVIPDRIFHHNLRVHGIVARLSVSSSLSAPTESLADRDARELLPLGEPNLVIHRSSSGTRIHNIRPGADATFSVHFPIVAAERFLGLASVTRLYLGAVSVDFRVLGSRGSVVRVSVYDGPDQIVAFSGLSLSGDHPDERFELDEIKPFSRGLDVVLTLGTPLGLESSFEFRSVGVTLVTRGPALSPDDMVLAQPE